MLTAGVGKPFQHALKLIQHRFNFVSTCFITIERERVGGGGEGANGFIIAVQQNRTDVEAPG